MKRISLVSVACYGCDDIEANDRCQETAISLSEQQIKSIIGECFVTADFDAKSTTIKVITVINQNTDHEQYHCVSSKFDDITSEIKDKDLKDKINKILNGDYKQYVK